MRLTALLDRLSPRRPAVDAPASESPPAEAAEAAATPARATAGRRELELTLARKILETHLRVRRAQMQGDPTDLRGVKRDAARLLIRAMVAAAHADGRLDPMEERRIGRALASTRLNDAERAELEAAIAEPPGLEPLLRAVADEETATRFYAVSLAAAERGRGANKAYLAYLASRLKLPRDVVLRLNRAFDVPV